MWVLIMNNENIIKFSKWCAHFYGVVTFSDIKEAIHHYNHEVIDEEIIEKTLQGFISKRTTIQIYKNFVYKANTFDDTKTISQLYDQAKIHEFYYPDRKPEFFFFEASTYASITYPHSKNLYDYLETHLTMDDRYFIADDICTAAARSFMAGNQPDYILNHIFKECHEELAIHENEIHEFVTILINAFNNTRRYDLRGFTPMEVRQGVKSKPYAY